MHFLAETILNLFVMQYFSDVIFDTQDVDTLLGLSYPL
jgi:hypothetical protein